MLQQSPLAIETLEKNTALRKTARSRVQIEQNRATEAKTRRSPDKRDGEQKERPQKTRRREEEEVLVD